MKKILIFCLACFVFQAQAQENKDILAIRKVLEVQQRAWNNADIAAFMAGYWKSEDLKFVGKNGITKGWQQTLDNYKKNYPDKAAMGLLNFDILHIEKLSDKTAFVIGKWHLKREKDELGGHFTLLWKKIKGEWLIVADHSS